MTEWLPSGRLGRQIAIAFVSFALLLTLALGIGLVSALKSIERSMLDDTLLMELAHFRSPVETERALGAFHSRTTIIHTASLDAQDDLPAHLRGLPLGNHDVVYHGRDYRVLVEELDGVRYTVQFDDTNIIQREREFTRWVWISSIGMLAFSFPFGWWIANRLSLPSQRLAQQIRTLSEKPEGELDVSQFQDDEIGLLARRLHDHHEQLSCLLTREKEFAGNVSHELRTPVTTISLAAEVLASKKSLSEKDAEKIDRIQRAAREMSELVDTFLVLSRLSNDTNTYSACEVAPLVEDVVAQQRVWLGSRPVDVHVNIVRAFQVTAPPRVVSVLIANLVRNAFRYTQEGSVTVIVDSNRVTVEDTGIGINSATQAKMFERHSRGDSVNADGAGLGLSIVRRICERYDWQVKYANREQNGSRFTVLFQPMPATI